MKNILLIIIILLPFKGTTQLDTIQVDNIKEAADLAFGQLDPMIYNYCLLNRTLDMSEFVTQQVNGNYDHIFSPMDWMVLFNLKWFNSPTF